MIVILTATNAEGHEYRRVAKLAKRDVIIPASGDRIAGYHLGPDDLIVEFPSFKDHPQADEIRAALKTSASMSSTGPPLWERISDRHREP